MQTQTVFPRKNILYLLLFLQADTMNYMVGFPDFIMNDVELNEKHETVS